MGTIGFVMLVLGALGAAGSAIYFSMYAPEKTRAVLWTKVGMVAGIVVAVAGGLLQLFG